VVVLIRRPSAEATQGGAIVDHYVLGRSGSFYFVFLDAGTYAVGAFHDRNGDLVYDADEPVLIPSAQTTFTMETGDSREVALVIDPAARASLDEPLDVRALQARSAEEQIAVTAAMFTRLGEVVDLDESRFDAASGQLGLWKPVDFLLEIGAGVYFLEEYDPRRIPVLFIHGVSGYPREFADLIASLDAERFQAWFFQYPSGSDLSVVAELLSQCMVKLRIETGFDRVFVVAHSVGGLVARAFVLRHAELAGDDSVRALLTLATPWAGHEAAASGVRALPYPIYSWFDLEPKSPFLRDLFWKPGTEPPVRRRLPDEVSAHLLFGWERRALSGLPGDGVVSFDSQLRAEAQLDADSIFGVPADHARILRHPLAIERVTEILGELAARR
jgi:pimeloyl-ACP methyl ester carboxylesterase